MELKADAGSVPGVCVGGRVLSGRGAEPLTYVMLITIRLEDSSFVLTTQCGRIWTDFCQVVNFSPINRHQ